MAAMTMADLQEALTVSSTAAAAAAATAAVNAFQQQQPQHHGQHGRMDLPAFWKADPAGWFLHAEAKFFLMGYVAGSHTCYLHAVGALQPDVQLTVRDITRTVTALTPRPYALLKAALTSRYCHSPLQSCYQLLTLQPLGDRHPTALFAELMALVPEDTDVLLNAIFLRLLPDNMRAALNDKGHLPPRQLAEAAALLHHPGASATAVTTGDLTVAAARPSHRSSSRSPSRARQQTPHRGASPDRRPLKDPPASSDLCFYHYHYRGQARNCKKPCAWRSGN
jgi:hypothetical protein